MRAVLAIDPGPVQSAYLVLNPDGRPRPGGFAIAPNPTVLEMCRRDMRLLDVDACVIEGMESFGMPVGREIFESVRWSGRFEEALDRDDGVVVTYVPRRAVKLHLCGTSRAKDPNVRAALMDRFGGAGAQGTKRAPGPLYGVSKDVWSALGLAVTFDDARRGRDG